MKHVPKPVKPKKWGGKGVISSLLNAHVEDVKYIRREL
jgi:hypothetical protein